MERESAFREGIRAKTARRLYNSMLPYFDNSSRCVLLIVEALKRAEYRGKHSKKSAEELLLKSLQVSETKWEKEGLTLHIDFKTASEIGLFEYLASKGLKAVSTKRVATG